jgi:hypothetical protein
LILTALAGCGKPPAGQVAVVNIDRIANNWPKFINYHNQLGADEAALGRSNASPTQKERAAAALQQRYARLENEVTDDVRNAAEQVAKEKNYKLVVTRQWVGYGGDDITGDVERILKITEPTPSP